VAEGSSAGDQRGALVAAGALAGFVSALFGVGGGIVIVPVLMRFGGFGPRRAAATSLAAIMVIAAWGTLTQGALGNVDWRAAMLIGIPAMAGVTVGVAVKNRLSTEWLTLAFAGLMVAVAVVLVAQ
jgi:uncharacterized membrane protein YfcA